jgi:AcrR family transcriptional regulator
MPYPVPLPGSAAARLIEAGIAQFQAHGFERAGVADIAAAAGVTTGALYHHFTNKVGLYAVIREEMERRITERIDGAASALGGGRAGVEGALLVAFDAAVRFRVTRVLAEADPAGRADVVAAVLATAAAVPAVRVRCAVGAWRGALAAAADGADPAEARAALHWLLGGADD